MRNEDKSSIVGAFLIAGSIILGVCWSNPLLLWPGAILCALGTLALLWKIGNRKPVYWLAFLLGVSWFSLHSALALNGIGFTNPFAARLFCVLTAYLPGGICIFLFWKRGTCEIARTLAQLLCPIALLCFLPLKAVLAEIFLGEEEGSVTLEPWQPGRQVCQLKMGNSTIICAEFSNDTCTLYRIDHIGLGLQSFKPVLFVSATSDHEALLFYQNGRFERVERERDVKISIPLKLEAMDANHVSVIGADGTRIALIDLKTGRAG